MSAHFNYFTFLATYGRQISDVTEFNTRLEYFNFVDNFINEHNASGASWVAGHNQFSDWAPVEFKSILGYVEDERMEDDAETKWFDESVIDDFGVNWVEKGAVTPVKNQGNCGSCWAFSSTGALEGAHFIATGELLSFSEQQLVSCSGILDGNSGCNGGIQLGAFRYYKSHMAELESAYPYKSGKTGLDHSCKYDEMSKTAVDVSSYTRVAGSSPEQMKAALMQQPLSVSVHAGLVFQTYKSGVFDDKHCLKSLDHAVLAVGYGTENGQEYWLIKNSWEATWGDKGYIKMAITDGDGICGIQMSPLFPTSN